MKRAQKNQNSVASTPEFTLRRSLTRFSVLMTTAACLTVVISSGREAGANKKPDVEYELLSQGKYALNSSINVRFKLINLSTRSLRVLKWNTLLEPISNDILIVRCDNIVLPYQGPMIKRGRPSSEDYEDLPPDRTIVVSDIDLAEVYAFPANGQCMVDIKPFYLKQAIGAASGPASEDILIQGRPANFTIG